MINTCDLSSMEIKFITDKMFYNGGMVHKTKKIFSDELVEIFKTFEIENLDYKDLIDKYKDYKKCLFLFDPPYFCTSKTYKENYINVDEYINMIKIIIEKCKNFVFVSYDSQFLNYIVNHEV